MELPARWFKAASRTEKGVFSVPRWSFGGSGTERGVFSVRDGAVPDGLASHRGMVAAGRQGKAVPGGAGRGGCAGRDGFLYGTFCRARSSNLSCSQWEK